MDLQILLNEIAEEMPTAPDRGTVARYIPEFDCVDPARFALALALPGGECLTAGDADEAFWLQSISKFFTLAIALGRLGDRLWTRVGREPSGLAFNSILQLEGDAGIPRNPLVNVGALVVTDAIVTASTPPAVMVEILSFIRAAVGEEDIHSNKSVAASELGASQPGAGRIHGSLRQYE